MKLHSASLREGSDLTHLYTEADEGGPYTIHFDVWFTRRKRYHVIADRQGRPLFRSRWVTDCLNWLDARDVEEYTTVADDVERVVRQSPMSKSEGTTQ